MNCVNRVLQTELNAVSFPTPSLPRHSSSSRHPPPTGTPTPETTCLTQKFQWGTNICWGNHLWLFFDRDLWPPFPNTSNDRTAVSNVHVDLVAKWVFFLVLFRFVNVLFEPLLELWEFLFELLRYQYQCR